MRLKLEGCTTQPLGSYLKALAVLRLVAEQKDSEARGWWGVGSFQLESSLEEDVLLKFFLDEYRPTPLIAPWNGGSGFYPKDRKIGAQAIMQTTGARFEAFREAIRFASALPEVAAVEKAATASEEDERRSSILRQCRNHLPDACVSWLDAAVSIASNGERSFAPILG
ncbi:MAG: type I-G CRISPR-associated protein Cas8g1/Csx17, partial [Limisphaerales bacterium]